MCSISGFWVWTLNTICRARASRPDRQSGARSTRRRGRSRTALAPPRHSGRVDPLESARGRTRWLAEPDRSVRLSRQHGRGPGRVPPGRCPRQRVRARARGENLEEYGAGPAARSATTGAGAEHAATASSSASRASTRISRNAWHVRRLSSRRSISRPSAVRPRGSLPYTWSMNGPESKPCSCPTRRPSLSRAPARDAAASVRNRQARTEEAGSSR